MWESSQVSGGGERESCQLVLAWSGGFSALPLLHELQVVLRLDQSNPGLILQKKEVARAVRQQNWLCIFALL